MLDCSPDFIAENRQARFRGANFFVEGDGITYGRRIKTHEFPNRDRPYQEDLGEKAIDFKVTAYIAGDNYRADRDALIAACRQRGAGTLALPQEKELRVVCFECKRDWRKDKQGFFAFELHFGEEGEGFLTVTSALLQRLVGVAGANAITQIATGFNAAYNIVGEASWVAAGAVSASRSWLTYADALRLEMQTKTDGDETGATLAADIAAFADNASAVAYGGAGLPIVQQGALGNRRAFVEAPMAARVAETVAHMRLAAASDEQAVETLTALAAYDVRAMPDDPLPQDPAFATWVELSASAKAERANEIALGQLWRRTALVELALAVSGIEYADRRRAIKARADVAELFSREMYAARGNVFDALDQVRGQAVQAISRNIADIRPAVVIEANASLPSYVWAYRLYADASKGTALAARNRVRHPGLMPTVFEAEAP